VFDSCSHFSAKIALFPYELLLSKWMTYCHYYSYMTNLKHLIALTKLASLRLFLLIFHFLNDSLSLCIQKPNTSWLQLYTCVDSVIQEVEQGDHISLGVRDQPRRHSEIPSKKCKTAKRNPDANGVIQNSF
jgi:hypothetical protein